MCDQPVGSLNRDAGLACCSLQHPHRPGDRSLHERAALYSAAIDLVGRLTAVAWVGEDVVDDQRTTAGSGIFRGTDLPRGLEREYDCECVASPSDR